LFLGLLYHDKSLGSGVQTIRPGWAGPVSYLLGGMTLTGCFFWGTISYQLLALKFLCNNNHVKIPQSLLVGKVLLSPL
jgi:hypothetical protein